MEWAVILTLAVFVIGMLFVVWEADRNSRRR
jgi:hypothetical protein